MKKTYIIPSTEAIKVEVEEMMALSTVEGNAQSTSDVLSRDGGMNSWFDEEEEKDKDKDRDE